MDSSPPRRASAVEADLERFEARPSGEGDGSRTALVTKEKPLDATEGRERRGVADGRAVYLHAVESSASNARVCLRLSRSALNVLVENFSCPTEKSSRFGKAFTSATGRRIWTVAKIDIRGSTGAPATLPRTGALLLETSPIRDLAWSASGVRSVKRFIEQFQVVAGDAAMQWAAHS